MKKLLTILMITIMSMSVLTGCGSESPTNENNPVLEEKEPEIVGTAVLFSDYTKNFGKSLEEVEEDVGKLEALDGWLGVLWYQLTEDEMFGFTYDNDEMILVSAYVPLYKIYPQLEGKTLSKAEFEEYLNTETEFVPLTEESEVASPYLMYDYDGLKVSVFCDDDGNIGIDSSIMFSEE